MAAKKKHEFKVTFKNEKTVTLTEDDLLEIARDRAYDIYNESVEETEEVTKVEVK